MIISFSDRYKFEKYKILNDDFEGEFYKALFDFLDANNISRSSYVLKVPDGGGSGQLCLHSEGNFWTVYSSERGERLNPSFFCSPWDAANYLAWNLLKRDGEKFPKFIFDPLKWASK